MDVGRELQAMGLKFSSSIILKFVILDYSTTYMELKSTYLRHCIYISTKALLYPDAKTQIEYWSKVGGSGIAVYYMF